MQWISKTQPIYVWSEDSWLNERTKDIYTPNIQLKCWECGEKKEYFTKKTKLMDKNAKSS